MYVLSPVVINWEDALQSLDPNGRLQFAKKGNNHGENAMMLTRSAIG